MRTIRKVNDISKARKKAKKGGWTLVKVSGNVYQTERLKKPKKAKKLPNKNNRTPGTGIQYSKKIGGRRFALYGTRKAVTKKEAVEIAKNARMKPDYNARVVKVKGGYAVYVNGKKKKASSKKKSSTKKKSDQARFNENFNPFSVSMTRKFNGKKYSIVTEDRNKRYVESVARRLRAGNAKQMPRNARVVKTSKGYAVYSRNK